MIGTKPKNGERLYLHKDNENGIYVDNCQNLKQHQIDSLRFLYRQFKKNKSGAVLNFPPGSGKSLVVTLFLNAISSLLNERVLIFCNDDKEIDHWNELLLTWTNYKSDEIAIESSNPRLKKKIFIKKAEDLNSYLRCHWGVVVIKDENMCKTLQKAVLDADLKIWITSTDVKKDVDLLFFIYNWMFPKSNVNINEIITSQMKPQDKMIQSIIMDTFIEEFVIRENKVKVIKETKNSQELKLYRDNQKGITRKNKDATGNKIKKSKRTIDTPMEQTSNIPDCNISTEIKEDPSETSRHLADIEDKSSVQDFDSINLLQIDQTHTIKIESKSLDLKAENNIVTEENSTESLDFGEVQENLNTISLDFVDNIKENSNATETYFEDEAENPDNKNVCIENQNVNQENIKDIKRDTTEKSEICNNLDCKMSELEERTMKKFKGSLLDSLF